MRLGNKLRRLVAAVTVITLIFGLIMPYGNERAHAAMTVGNIYTIVGTGERGYDGGEGPAIEATLNSPDAMTVDADGSLYFTDTGSDVVRKVDADGIITTIAGTGIEWNGSNGGLFDPQGIAVDSQGNVYFADTRRGWIRKVDPEGNVTTIVGDGGGLWYPMGLAIDSEDNLYIADRFNHAVKKMDPAGHLTIVVGTGDPDYSGDGGRAVDAQLNNPQAVAFDAEGNLYISDSGNSAIRKVDTDGEITTIANLGSPAGIAVDGNGNLYIVSDNAIWQTDTAGSSSSVKIAGTGDWGYSDDGTLASDALLKEPVGIALDGSGNLYIADSGNSVIRKVILNALSSDADLEGLELYGLTPLDDSDDSAEPGYDKTEIELSPAFDSGTLSYTASVGYDVEEITIKPTKVHPLGSVKVDGERVTSGTDSEPIELDTGDNEIEIVVQAEDGTLQTYTITVTRAGSGNADLTNLYFFDGENEGLDGELTPAFDPDKTEYTYRVERDLDEIIVLPLPDDHNQTITINGTEWDFRSPNYPESIALHAGVNPISIVITAGDGTQKTYTVTVRVGPPSSEKEISEFSFAGLAPTVTGTITGTDIALTVPYGTDVTSLVASFTHSELSTVKVGTVTQVSGTTANDFTNPVSYTVTAEDGTTRTYTVTVKIKAYVQVPGNSGGGSVTVVPNTDEPAIEWNGKKLDAADIDTGKPSIKLEATPKDGEIVVSIPAKILAELSAKNADFYVEIKAPYGSYQVPANLALILPNLQALLTKNNLQVGDISFKITLTDKSGDKGLQAAIGNALQNGKLLSPIVDFHIDILDAKTGLTIGTADKFAKSLKREMLLPNVKAGLSKPWGAFRYDDRTKKLEFVPAKSAQTDGVWSVWISSYTNSVYIVAENELSFGDVWKHWAKSLVYLAASKGLVEGIGAGKFAPDQTVTRAEFTVMLIRSLGRGDSSGSETFYDDVAANVWYSEAVAAAKELGLLEFAKGNSFKPNQALTREEMASMLAEAIRLEQPTMTSIGVSLGKYKDLGSVDESDLENIRLVTKLGIMTGTSEKAFSPTGVTTRAQAAAVFVRTLQALDFMDRLD